MFGKKEDKKQFSGQYTPFFIDAKGAWKSLALERDLIRLDKKLNLILDHLNLQYVPETEKKEPAKLVGKEECLTSIYPCDMAYVGTTPPTVTFMKGADTTYKPKKKRGRPKKK